MDWRLWKSLPNGLANMLLEVVIGQWPTLACGTLAIAAISTASNYAAVQAIAEPLKYGWMPGWVSLFNLRWDEFALFLALTLAWNKRRLTLNDHSQEIRNQKDQAKTREDFLCREISFFREEKALMERRHQEEIHRVREEESLAERRHQEGHAPELAIRGLKVTPQEGSSSWAQENVFVKSQPIRVSGIIKNGGHGMASNISIHLSFYGQQQRFPLRLNTLGPGDSFEIKGSDIYILVDKDQRFKATKQENYDLNNWELTVFYTTPFGMQRKTIYKHGQDSTTGQFVTEEIIDPVPINKERWNGFLSGHLVGENEAPVS